MINDTVDLEKSRAVAKKIRAKDTVCFLNAFNALAELRLDDGLDGRYVEGCCTGPVAVQLCLAWGFERVMKVPLVSIAQVRILAQGAFQPLPGCGTLPERLTPKTHLHRKQIRKGLPPARRFGLRDLRFCT